MVAGWCWKYLKTRGNTVKCIVQSLIDDSGTELTEELQKSEGPHLDHSFQAPWLLMTGTEISGSLISGCSQQAQRKEVC